MKGRSKMKARKLIFGSSLLATAICGQLFAAQDAVAPVVNIDPSRHGNLAAAQGDIVDAYQRIDMAQSANNDQLGGHAQKAKDFLAQADAELRSAADFANARQDAQQEQSEPGPDNASGNWTIYAQ